MIILIVISTLKTKRERERLETEPEKIEHCNEIVIFREQGQQFFSIFCLPVRTLQKTALFEMATI